MRTGPGCGLVSVLDLDRFSRVNHRYGVPTGDRLLAEVERRLQRAARDALSALRLGGDQFLVMLPAHHQHDAVGRALARAVRSAHVRSRGRRASVSASIGISRWSKDDGTLFEALCAASRALALTKLAGGNGWLYLPPE